MEFILSEKAENAKGYIEKRKIELGEYDENMMRYQILSGLTEDDYIAKVHEALLFTGDILRIAKCVAENGVNSNHEA